MVTVGEAGASTAELVAVKGADSITKLANFDGLTADLTVNTAVNQAVGNYEYYIRIVWDDGSVDIITKSEDCSDDDCPMPVISVCAIPQVGP